MLPLQPLNPLILPIINILPHPSSATNPSPNSQNKKTHLSSQPIILLTHIHSPPILPQPQPLFLTYLLCFPIVVLVSQRGGGREEEGAGDDSDDEGEAEEEEGGARYGGAVPGAERGLVGAGAEFFGGEGWHCDGGLGSCCGACGMVHIWRTPQSLSCGLVSNYSSTVFRVQPKIFGCLCSLRTVFTLTERLSSGYC